MKKIKQRVSDTCKTIKNLAEWMGHAIIVLTICFVVITTPTWLIINKLFAPTYLTFIEVFLVWVLLTIIVAWCSYIFHIVRNPDPDDDDENFGLSEKQRHP